MDSRRTARRSLSRSQVKRRNSSTPRQGRPAAVPRQRRRNVAAGSAGRPDLTTPHSCGRLACLGGSAAVASGRRHVAGRRGGPISGRRRPPGTGRRRSITRRHKGGIAMIGRPERARTNVRLVRRAQPRATRRHALPLTVTIVVITVFVAALFTRATGSGAALIGRWDPPVASTPNRGQDDGGSPTSRDASSPGSAGPISEGDIIGAARHIGCAGLVLVADRIDAAAARLPGRRRARGHAAYDDWQRTIVDTTSRLPKGYVPPDLVAGFPGGSVRRRLHSAHRDRGSQGPRRTPRERPGCDSRSSRPTGARPGSNGRSRVGSAPQEKPRPDVSVRAQDTRSTSSGPPSISRPRAAGRRGRRHSRARGMRDGWRRMPGGSAGSRAIRRVRRHGPATALRPGTTAMSDGTSPPRSTRRG